VVDMTEEKDKSLGGREWKQKLVGGVTAGDCWTGTPTAESLQCRRSHHKVKKQNIAVAEGVREIKQGRGVKKGQ